MSGSRDLRLWSADDDVSALTALLNEAYRPLGEGGMRFVATWQDDEVTRRRIADRECWVLYDAARPIGTITLTPPGRATGCDWYARADVATFGQFAVDPAHQRSGLGSALVAHVERRALALGAAELALDTAEQATDLIDWYLRLGYRRVDRVDWPATNFVSVVLAKSLRDGAGTTACGRVGSARPTTS
ncbi:MAG TPA: GNAT family N-acetyltransferase [Mycobacteriales bacterium]|nr:GNAT family N-acetyltransferase [Mycobacteriales bacterium]